MGDEVDLHQARCPVRDTGGREHRVGLAGELYERLVDRGSVAKVDLDRLRHGEVDGRVVHDDDLDAPMPVAPPTTRTRLPSYRNRLMSDISDPPSVESVLTTDR